MAASAGTLVVLNKSEATASLIDLDSGRVAATVPTGQAPHEVAVSPDGRLALASNYGTREAPVESIPVGPGKTSLQKGEIIASFLLPAKPARTGEAYLRFIPRTEMDIAVVGAGVCLTLDSGGKCTAARVSLGAVTPRPLLVAPAAAASTSGPGSVAVARSVTSSTSPSASRKPYASSCAAWKASRPRFHGGRLRRSRVQFGNSCRLAG